MLFYITHTFLMAVSYTSALRFCLCLLMAVGCTSALRFCLCLLMAVGCTSALRFCLCSQCVTEDKLCDNDSPIAMWKEITLGPLYATESKGDSNPEDTENLNINSTISKSGLRSKVWSQYAEFEGIY